MGIVQISVASCFSQHYCDSPPALKQPGEREAHQKISERDRTEDAGVEKVAERSAHSAQPKLLVEPGQLIERGSTRAPMLRLVGHDVLEHYAPMRADVVEQHPTLIE
jgi:hypothetical protein